MPNYFPIKESDRREWYLSFQTNFPAFGASLNLSQQEISDWGGKLRTFLNHIDHVSQKERELETSHTERDEYRKIEMALLHQAIKHWKSHPNYTKAMGELLNIETTVSIKTPKNVSARTLDVSITAEIQKVNLTFKKSKTLMVAIYSRRGNETEFSLLRQILSNSFEDRRPNLNNAAAERREYYFTIIKNDEEIDRSGIYTVAVAQ